MAERAKRFYLCNLIPLWEIDEKDMDVDWPQFHAYFGDLIEMRADVKNRRVRFSPDNGVTVDPDLKVRFEINESDFLLSGGLNDHMATFSSHAGFGDDATVRPLKIVADVDALPEADREKFIFLHWIDGHETTVTVTAPDGTETKRTDKVPDTLQLRCFWRVAKGDGDVSGNPEFYYDVFVEGKLVDGKGLKLHERSDHELEGFSWNVTDKVRKGRVEPLIDGEYAFIKMLQMIDAAQHTIHILSWKLDQQAGLVIEPEFQPDYFQVSGLTPAGYQALLNRCKPLVTGVSADSHVLLYTASNGNVVAATTDGTTLLPAVQLIDDPTNIDLPSAVHMLAPDGQRFLVLDQLRSRLLLFLTAPAGGLAPLIPDRGVFAAAVAPGRALPFYQVRPTLNFPPGTVSGLMALAGEGNPGFADGGLASLTNAAGSPTGFVIPAGAMNRPTAMVLAEKAVFITDTGNHCIRKLAPFDPADLLSTLRSSLTLSTLAGKPKEDGLADGTGSAARFTRPAAITFDSIAGRLLVSDGNHELRAVNPTTGAVTTLSLTGIDGVSVVLLGDVAGLAFNPALGPKGTLYLSQKDRHRILALDLDTRAAVTLTGSRDGSAGHADGALAAARFNRPMGLSLHGTDLYVADSANHVVRVVDLAAGTVRTIGSPTVAGPEDIPIVLSDLLRRKAEQGVQVRVLIDGLGAGIARDQPSPPSRGISISGRQTEDDLRFLHSRIQAFTQNHVQTLFDKTVASYHEKAMIVDGRQAVVGGIDFDDERNDGLLHNRRHRISIFWHDAALFVEGEAALGVEEAFVRRWSLAHDELKTEPGREAPDAITVEDRTDPAIQDVEAEAVRTFDPTPLFGFLPNLGNDAVQEILASYRRGILAARRYVYVENQYIYFPELGDILARAMQENPRLQVIWGMPFFTEESKDPVHDRLELRQAGALATSMVDASKLLGGQAQKQFAWHGFFRLKQMVDKLRKVDAGRFGVFAFSVLVQSPLTGDFSAEIIYPHSKLLLCDDRFLSIGSANTNGRGFAKDGELNVSALAPAAGAVLRERLWGEHLGYLGVAITQPDGSLFLTNGHQLAAKDVLRLRHPDLAPLEVERTVDSVDPATGKVFLTGAALGLGPGRRVFWRDPRLAATPAGDALALWRKSAQSLSVFRKVQGRRATTNAAGHLVIPGHLAQVGDKVVFGHRLMELNDEGQSSGTEPKIRELTGGALEVSAVTGDTIQFKPQEVFAPLTEAMKALALETTFDLHPFACKLKDKSGGRARLQILGLMPNQKDIPFDYQVSFLLRQPGGKKWVRTWEIDPPEGLKYSGPGTVIFSPWLIIPWIFVDFDPDEQALNQLPATGDRLA